MALRLRDGGRDWPAVRQELGRGTHGKLPQAELLAAQSVNTERSIRPQAVALWLLAALFGAIGLLILGQLLARLTFLEAAEFGTWRALGMSRVQLLAASLARAAVIGVAGGVAAVAATVAFSPLLPVGLARVAEPHPGIDADVLVLAGGAAAAIVVTVTLTAWPGWRAAARGPLALAYAGPGPAAQASLASRVVTAGPVSLGMGLRFALRRGAAGPAVPVRSAIASATVGVAALSAAIVFGGSLSYLLASPALYGVTWDAMLSNTAGGGLGPAVATIRRDPQVAAWTTAWSGAPLLIGPVQADAVVLPEPGGASFVPPPVSGRLPRTSREIALGARTLRAAHARIGETIGVSAAGGRAHAMTIVGITVFPTLSDGLDLGAGAQVTPAALRYLLPAAGAVPPADTLFVRYRPGVTAQRPPGPGHPPGAGRPARPVRGQRPGYPDRPAQLRPGAGPAAAPRGRAGRGRAADHRPSADHLGTAAAARLRGPAGARFHLLAGPVDAGWQGVTLAGLALVIGVPAGIICGRLGWLIFAHQLGITAVVAVPSVGLSVMSAGWLAAAVVIAALPGEAAARSRPASVLRSE